MIVFTSRLMNIVRSTLDLLDPRLVNHGMRVTNLVYRVLKLQNKYTAHQMRDICMAALLHDIGAYKTEEIDRMIRYETHEVWNHTLYGYMYMKYFSPLPHVAPIVFFHHADSECFGQLGEAFELGQIINIADRMDIIVHCGGTVNEDRIVRFFEANRGKKYRSDILDLFDDKRLYEGLPTPDPEIINGFTFSRREVEDFFRMMVLSIDFRSTQTVTHTLATRTISKILAELMHLYSGDVDRICTGAMLHDLGKQGIPTEILECPGRLTTEQMEIMKTHVAITDRILDGNVDEATRRIAVLHHEKLDGSGYPYGLDKMDLGVNERLVAVADIFSALFGVRSYKRAYPKSRIIGILAAMAGEGRVDGDIVHLATENFDYIVEAIAEESRDLVTVYEAFNREYAQLKHCIDLFRQDNSDTSFLRHIALDVFGHEPILNYEHKAV